MSELYLDVLRIGRRMGVLSFNDMKKCLVSKGYDWNKIEDFVNKCFSESFESTESQGYILKADVIRWLLDYETSRIKNIAIFLFSIVLMFIGYMAFRKQKVIPRVQVIGYKN